MVKEYKTLEYISNKLNVDRSIVSRFLKENNLELSKKKINKEIKSNFFEIIDTEEKAYLLGLFYTDGCVDKYDRIRICLKAEDIELLEKIKIILNVNNKLLYRKKGKSETYELSIDDKKMSYDLKTHGIIYNKTYDSTSIPKVNDDLVVPFLRGCFDGDGIFCFKNDINNASIGFCNYNKNIVEQYQELIDSLIEKKFHNEISYSRNPLGSSYNCRWRGTKQILKILDLLYSNSNIYLNRKYEKYLRFKKNALG